MPKLFAAILKDLKILFRDQAGLAVMFAMPILLVIVISSIQNSSFKLVNENKVPLLLVNTDTGEVSRQFIDALTQIGMFEIHTFNSAAFNTELISKKMYETEAMVAVAIPNEFSHHIATKAAGITIQALQSLGMATENNSIHVATNTTITELSMIYNPVMEESFRLSVIGALQSAQQFTENRQVLQALYQQLSNKKLPDSLEQKILSSKTTIRQLPVAKDGSRAIPNTSQHNVPAWTIFAMFFIVVTLSTNIVKEKTTGSFIRLKTLPTNYLLLLIAKQITFVLVTCLQALIIFSIGYWIFPLIGLPVLNLPANKLALLLITFFCGWSAVSYGLLVGVFSKTMEQAIGFGAVSVVILAAIGGVIVPAFAMPEILRIIMKISPLHWCIEAYYVLFLEGGETKNVLASIFPLFLFIIAMQTVSWLKLKQQKFV